MARASALPLIERVWQRDDAAKLRVRELVADFSIETHAGDRGQARDPRRPAAGGDPGLRRVRARRKPPRGSRDGGARPRRRPRPGASFSGALDHLRRVAGEAGVDEALLIGGGIDLPRGAFSGTRALLETGLFEARGIGTIGFAGHPEGQRALAAPAAAMTLEEKLAYARRTTARARLVTQFVFEAEPLLAWEHMVRAQGSHLPIHVGVPGPATLRSLLNYARLCGVGNSMRVLTRQAGNLLKLASLAYPDAMITALARQRAEDPQCRIERLHFYPFGGLARAARWIETIRAGAFTLHYDGRGFTVDGAAV